MIFHGEDFTDFLIEPHCLIVVLAQGVNHTPPDMHKTGLPSGGAFARIIEDFVERISVCGAEPDEVLRELLNGLFPTATTLVYDPHKPAERSTDGPDVLLLIGPVVLFPIPASISSGVSSGFQYVALRMAAFQTAVTCVRTQLITRWILPMRGLLLMLNP